MGCLLRSEGRTLIPATIQAEKNAPKIPMEIPHGTSGSQMNCEPTGIT